MFFFGYLQLIVLGLYASDLEPQLDLIFLRRSWRKKDLFMKNQTIDTLESVAYFKTHKTGSTTMASLLLRFAVRRNLTTFPMSNSLHNCYEKTKKHTKGGFVVINVSNYVYWNSSLRFHIINRHFSSHGHLDTMFDKVSDFYDTKMRQPFKIITTLRRPESQFRSWFNFFYRAEINEMNFIKNNAHNELQLQEFGFFLTGEKNISNFLSVHLRKIDLFVITEMYDESLVLMMLDYNWTFVDITYLPLNAQENKIRSNQSERLNYRVIKKLTRLSTIFYEEALLKLKLRIAAYPTAVFKNALALFRSLQRDVASVCKCAKHYNNFGMRSFIPRKKKGSIFLQCDLYSQYMTLNKRFSKVTSYVHDVCDWYGMSEASCSPIVKSS